MGQYYKAVLLNSKQKPKATIQSYDFGSGAKLMEHSWMLNEFVRFVELQLMFEPQRLVWAGDYADTENPDTLTTAELKPHVDDDSEHWNLEHLKKKGINLYYLSETAPKLITNEDVKDKYKHSFKHVAPLSARYIINHDKKLFVDKTKMPSDNDGWKIHPLPLLTAEGNGRGGGDYHEGYPNYENVGIWGRDLLEVTTRKKDIPKGYQELSIEFIEHSLESV